MSMGGKQGGEVTRRPRSPEGQGKYSDVAVCGFHAAPSSLMLREGYPRGRWLQNAKRIHLRLAFGCEGVESGGSGVETIESSGSRLDAREMEERQWCRCGFRCRCGFALSFRSGGEVSDLRMGLPLPGPPLAFLHPQLLRQSTRSRAHPSEEGRGRCGRDSSFYVCW